MSPWNNIKLNLDKKNFQYGAAQKSKYPMFSEYQIEQTVRKPFSFYGEERRMNEDTIMFD